MNMYPDLGPVEVGETLSFTASDMWWSDYIEVERMTKKLIYAGGMAFSRENGALFEVGGYDAYAGRVRKLTDDDRAEIERRQSSVKGASDE